MGHDPSSKILPLDALLAQREAARRAGRTVVQCHGCFDIVHPGHIRHLRQARGRGDALLVSITADGAVGKGAGRPLIPQELRAENLAELDCVDWVHINEAPTAAELLRRVAPDIYVKGSEYQCNDDPRFGAEREAVEAAGGRVLFSSGDVVFSSTALIRALETSVDPYHRRLRELLDRDDLGGPTLHRFAGAMAGRPLLIIGASALETYLLCDRPEVSPESPVMSLRPLDRRHYDGGAAALARCAAAMGARPILITALSDDPASGALRQRLLAEGVDVRPLMVDTPLAERQRFLAGAQKLLKVDLAEPMTLDTRQEARLLAMARGAAAECAGGGVILADDGQGMLGAHSARALSEAVRCAGGLVAMGVGGRTCVAAMRRLDAICLSERALRESAPRSADSLPAVTWRLLREIGARAAFITIDGEGLVAMERADRADPAEADDGWPSRLRSEHVPALDPTPIDTLGAPAAMATAVTLALAAGAQTAQAAMLGAIAAAVSGTRLGCGPVSAADLRRAIARLHASHITWAPDETRPMLARPSLIEGMSA